MERVIITVTGQQGSGKTTKLRTMVERCRRALFVDPEGKWQTWPGDVVVRSAPELLNYLGDVGASDPATPFRVVYRGDDADRMADVAPKLAFVIRNCSLVVDEWAWLCTASTIPEYLKRCI